MFMIIGAHVSIGGGIEHAVDNAISLACETFQIFTKNQTQWKEKSYTRDEVQKFQNKLNESSIRKETIASHDSYLINLCADNHDNLEKSRQSFLEEINRCTVLGIPYIIFHPGSHLGKGEAWGLDTIAESVQWLIDQSKESQVRLLLETTAGQGTNLGYTFEQLQFILSEINSDRRMGVCVDTCHIYAAGYDIRDEKNYHKTMNQLEKIIGLEKIKAFHLNDSKKELGTRVDRHERIGKGIIGQKAFEFFINDRRFTDTPGFLEVPGGDPAFTDDIRLLKKLRK
jgi:deoxyribonuclease-4